MDGEALMYAPPIEFTLIAHNVVTGEHAETGAVVATLNTGCDYWALFPTTNAEPFCHEMWPFSIDIADVVYSDDYVHGRFHVKDGNKYAVTPILEFAVYVGDRYTNVISYVQWNHIATVPGDEVNAYMFGIRAKRQIKRAIVREYTGLHIVPKGL